VTLLGDEQYQVGKLTDFEASFEHAWGGTQVSVSPTARQPRVLRLHQEGRQRARAERQRLLRLLQRPRPCGTPGRAPRWPDRQPLCPKRTSSGSQ
jgi:hypothetical protein